MKRFRVGGDPKRRRSSEYPPVGDQLDAISKGFRALQQQGFFIPAETMAWVEHCEAVKARLPKRDKGA